MTRYGDIARGINGLRTPQGSTELHGTLYFPSAQGKSDVSAGPVCSCAFLLVQFAHETAGAACTRLSLRPPIERVRKISVKARVASREILKPCLHPPLRPRESGDPVFQRRQ